jgi:hypothetical protein
MALLFFGLIIALVIVTFIAVYRAERKHDEVGFKEWLAGVYVSFDSATTLTEFTELRNYVMQTWRMFCRTIDQESRVLNVLIKIDRKLDELEGNNRKA